MDGDGLRILPLNLPNEGISQWSSYYMEIYGSEGQQMGKQCSLYKIACDSPECMVKTHLASPIATMLYKKKRNQFCHPGYSRSPITLNSWVSEAIKQNHEEWQLEINCIPVQSTLNRLKVESIRWHGYTRYPLFMDAMFLFHLTFGGFMMPGIAITISLHMLVPSFIAHTVIVTLSPLMMQHFSW